MAVVMASDSVTTTTTVAPVATTTTTVAAAAAAATTTTTVAAAAAAVTTTTTAAAAAPAGTPVFNFVGVDARCTKANVISALNATTCNALLDLTYGGNPSAVCAAADSCAVKAGSAFVQSKCPAVYAAQANLVCSKNGEAFLFTGALSKVSSVQSAVLAASTAPSLACDAQTDFVRQWLLADPSVTPEDAIFEAICQKSGDTSCWSSFFGYLKSSATPKDLATAATTTSNCGANQCSIAAAGLFAKYYNASTAQQVMLLNAIDVYSKGACVNSAVAKGVCGVQAALNTNLVAVASTFSINANSFYAPKYIPAAVVTAAPVAGTTTTTKAATATTTTTAAQTTTTTTQAQTTTTTTTPAPAQRRQLQASTTTAAATSAAAGTAAASTGTTPAAYPWVAVLKGVTDLNSACKAVADYNSVGCCGGFVGTVSALLGGASDSTLAGAATNLVTKVYPNAEVLCKGVVLDPTCQEGTAATGAAAVQSVTITFELNGVTCTGISNAVVAAMGEGMAMSFVASKLAPSMDAAEVSICSKSFREAKAALVTLSRRRLQAAAAALTVKGTAADLTAITDTKDATKGTAALAVLNTALTAAVQAGAAKALADPAAAADFAKFVDTTKLSVTPVTAASISAPAAVPPKTATTTFTGTTGSTGSTSTVSGAPAAMSAIFAPVCAVAAMFAASS